MRKSTKNNLIVVFIAVLCFWIALIVSIITLTIVNGSKLETLHATQSVKIIKDEMVIEHIYQRE